MRYWLMMGCLALVGCGNAVDAQSPPVVSNTNTQPVAQVPAELQLAQAPLVDPKATTPASVGDLRKRKTGSDWPVFLGPTGDSKSTETGIVKPWSKEGPPIVWTYKTGTGYSAPVTSLGQLYLFERVKNNVTLTCLKSETGEVLWKFEYPSDYQDMYGYDNGPRCSPTIDGERVYIYGPEGMLHCLTASTGDMLWKKNMSKDFGVVQNFFGVGSTPIVEGELLLVHVGGSPVGSGVSPSQDQKGNGSGMVALNKMTGEVKYKISDELASYASPVLTTVGQRRWCFMFARGGLLGFEPANGKVDFHFPWRADILESVNASNPVVVGNQVFISETYGPGSALLKVRPGGYEMVWNDEEKRREKSMQTHWNTPIHHEGYVYGSSGRHTQNAELRCIELATGKVMWSEPSLTRSSLLMIDGHFICLGEYGQIHLIKVNSEKFDEVSRIWPRREAEAEIAGFGKPPLLAHPAWAAPVVSHGFMYLRGEGILVCMDLLPVKAKKKIVD